MIRQGAVGLITTKLTKETLMDKVEMGAQGAETRETRTYKMS
jgi:hypothetical protein